MLGVMFAHFQLLDGRVQRMVYFRSKNAKLRKKSKISQLTGRERRYIGEWAFHLIPLFSKPPYSKTGPDTVPVRQNNYIIGIKGKNNYYRHAS